MLRGIASKTRPPHPARSLRCTVRRPLFRKNRTISSPRELPNPDTTALPGVFR